MKQYVSGFGREHFNQNYSTTKIEVKINYSSDFLFRNIETQSCRHYHRNHNNAQVLDRAALISNRHDLVNFLYALSEEDFLETWTRLSTKWQIVDNTNIIFYVTKLQDVALGAKYVITKSTSKKMTNILKS